MYDVHCYHPLLKGYMYCGLYVVLFYMNMKSVLTAGHSIVSVMKYLDLTWLPVHHPGRDMVDLQRLPCPRAGNPAWSSAHQLPRLPREGVLTLHPQLEKVHVKKKQGKVFVRFQFV